MKTLFAFKLYKQGLKMTKTTAIYGFISVIILNFAHVSKFTPHDKNSYVPHQLIAPYSFLAYFFAAYLVYQIFSYTKDRTASDLFESFPKKRICLLFTFGAAVATWTFAIIILSNVINAIAFNVFTKYTASILAFLSAIAVQVLFALFVITASLCAVAVSGSAISYCLSIASIMLLSSVLYLFALTILAEEIPYFKNSSLFLKQQYLFGKSPSHIGSSQQTFKDVVAYLVEAVYSLFPNVFELKAQSFILPLTLFPLSVFLFSKRKSCNAGIRSSKRPLAALVSITVSPVIVILLITLLTIRTHASFLPFLTAAVFFIISTVILKSAKKALTILPFSLVSVFIILFYIIFNFSLFQ